MVKFASTLCAEWKLETTCVGTPKHLITKEKKSMGTNCLFQEESLVSCAYFLTFKLEERKRPRFLQIHTCNSFILRAPHPGPEPCGLPALSIVSIPPGERNHLRVT